MDVAQVWERNPSLVWRRVGDEAVILDPDERVLRGLNPSAWHVWELLDGSHNLGEIAAALAEHFQILETRAMADVVVLIRDLERAGLIEKKR